MRSHIKRVHFLITFLAVFGLASASLSFTSVASAYPSQVVTPSDPTYIIQTVLKKITTFSSNELKYFIRLATINANLSSFTFVFELMNV